MKIFSPESIIIGFLKGFFSQEELYGGLKNEFRYYDNKDEGLLIKMTDYFNQEVYSEVPALIVQEGGFNERIQMMDNREWHMPISGQQGHRATFYHPLTIHCMTRFKGTSKILQSAVAQSIIAFRKAIYEFGIDNISQISGMPPSALGSQSKKTPQGYVAAVQFTLKMDNIWTLRPESEIEEAIKVQTQAIAEKVKYDDTGNVVTPPENFIKQSLSIQEK